jgi:hypothetical protein
MDAVLNCEASCANGIIAEWLRTASLRLRLLPFWYCSSSPLSTASLDDNVYFYESVFFFFSFGVWSSSILAWVITGYWN